MLHWRIFDSQHSGRHTDCRRAFRAKLIRCNCIPPALSGVLFESRTLHLQLVSTLPFSGSVWTDLLVRAKEPRSVQVNDLFLTNCTTPLLAGTC